MQHLPTLKRKVHHPHLGSCKHSLRYGWRRDGHFEVRAGMWNIGSVSGEVEKFVKN